MLDFCCEHGRKEALRCCVLFFFCLIIIYTMLTFVRMEQLMVRVASLVFDVFHFHYLLENKIRIATQKELLISKIY